MKTGYFIGLSLIAVLGIFVEFGCTKDAPTATTSNEFDSNYGVTDRDACANAIQIRLVSVSGGSTTEPEFSVYNSIEPWGYILNIGNGCLAEYHSFRLYFQVSERVTFGMQISSVLRQFQ